MGHQDGLDLLLESIAFLTKLRKCEDTLFVLIGSGPELPHLKVLASQKGLDALVKFTGQAARRGCRGLLFDRGVRRGPRPGYAHERQVNDE